MKNNYHHFRDKILSEYCPGNSIFKGWSQEESESQKVTFYKKRKLISDFRSMVSDHLATILEKEPELEIEVRKALRIPAAFPLFTSEWPLWRKFAQLFVPQKFLGIICVISYFRSRPMKGGSIYTSMRMLDFL